MFNSYSQSNQFNFDINAVNGTLRKSHPKSKMMIRKLEKDMACFSTDTPAVDCYKTKEIVILQTMLIGDGKALIEYVDKKDFEADITSDLERSIFTVITTEPDCNPTCKVFTDEKEVEKYIRGFVEYVIQKLLPEEDGLLEFTCPADIHLWIRKNTNKLPGILRYNSRNFFYDDGHIYSANYEEHKIPVNLDKEV